MNHPSKQRLLASAALLVSLAAGYASEPTAQYWQELGSSASGSGISHETSGHAGVPAAVVNPSTGHVFVAWESSTSEIFLRKWTGTEWVQLGNSATGGGISN